MKSREYPADYHSFPQADGFLAVIRWVDFYNIEAWKAADFRQIRRKLGAILRFTPNPKATKDLQDLGAPVFSNKIKI